METEKDKFVHGKYSKRLEELVRDLLIDGIQMVVGLAWDRGNGDHGHYISFNTCDHCDALGHVTAMMMDISKSLEEKRRSEIEVEELNKMYKEDEIRDDD